MKTEQERKYVLEPPKYFRGQYAEFINHRGNYDNGKIVQVETHYFSREDDVGYHIYGIRKPNNTNLVYIAEENIMEVSDGGEK